MAAPAPRTFYGASPSDPTPSRTKTSRIPGAWPERRASQHQPPTGACIAAAPAKAPSNVISAVESAPHLWWAAPGSLLQKTFRSKAQTPSSVVLAESTSWEVHVDDATPPLWSPLARRPQVQGRSECHENMGAQGRHTDEYRPVVGSRTTIPTRASVCGSRGESPKLHNSMWRVRQSTSW